MRVGTKKIGDPSVQREGRASAANEARGGWPRRASVVVGAVGEFVAREEAAERKRAKAARGCGEREERID